MLRKVYQNVHATTLPIQKGNHPSNSEKLSILLIGIDSISKPNLIRTMPKTFKYAEEHSLSLQGYNKVGDNTFPNLMALLTGYSMEQMRGFNYDTVKINTLQIIWDEFREAGYVTGYGEDESDINTFNYEKAGFLDPPTDFYYFPYIIAAEKLATRQVYGLTFCSGPENTAQRILNAAKDFAVSFKDAPSFGLFWMNSFSHDDINLPSTMDEAMLRFLSDEELHSSLRNTILLFFSDHGYRFGDIRLTHSGWLEERIPFMYFFIPESFKKKFPKKYGRLVNNTERLTTPYDVFNTIEEVLKIGNASYVARGSRGCPGCKSLFEEIPENRTCEDASIDENWCACTHYNSVGSKGPIVRSIAEYIVWKINTLTRTFSEGTSCAQFNMKEIFSAEKSRTREGNGAVEYYLLKVETVPKAKFEGTVKVYSGERFELIGEISRIDRYGKVSGCVEDAILRKYCYCDGIYRYLKGFVFD
ncbi:hypothetical protein JTB14_009729 [Gonioctena quinquepunctata]|nr:hypothetical protein JTB14_009729 [Gonioctena quinquepunctata]